MLTEDASRPELAEKLPNTLHLNVAERRMLPARGIPFSLLVEAASSLLSRFGYLPMHRRPDHDFIGIVLEQRHLGIIVHERQEIGVGRLSPVRSDTVPYIRKALKRYLSVNGGDSIDGIAIEFHR